MGGFFVEAKDMFQKFFHFNVLAKKFFNSLLANVEITKIEYAILVYILRKKEIGEMVTASELAEEYHVSIPAIMHKLEILERDKYVKRTVYEKDKRIKHYAITERAINLCEGIRKEFDQRIVCYLDFLGKEDVAHLERLLDNTLKYMEEQND